MANWSTESLDRPLSPLVHDSFSMDPRVSPVSGAPQLHSSAPRQSTEGKKSRESQPLAFRPSGWPTWSPFKSSTLTSYLFA